jgi:hypothetical protein
LLERGRGLQAELFIFNRARPGDQKQPSRRIEVFPDGGVVEHAEVLAAMRRKVNDGSCHLKKYEGEASF